MLIVILEALDSLVFEGSYVDSTPWIPLNHYLLEEEDASGWHHGHLLASERAVVAGRLPAR